MTEDEKPPSVVFDELIYGSSSDETDTTQQPYRAKHQRRSLWHRYIWSPLKDFITAVREELWRFEKF